MDSKYQFNRESNIELFRILVMMSIVAHHMVVNTPVIYSLLADSLNVRNAYLWVFGMWGKIGINCFVLITGWYMCKSAITLKKFLKLLLEVYFYKFFNYALLLCVGEQTLSLKKIFYVLSPIVNVINDEFVNCYLVFFLMIPFLNVLIHNISEKMHRYLILLSVGVLCVWNQLYWIEVAPSYLLWFPTLYFVASYFRLYPESTHKLSLFLEKTPLLWIVASIASVVGIAWLMPHIQKDITPYYFVMDSDAILAFITGLSLFMYFKSIHIRQSKVINILAACSFGVLLFHCTAGMKYVLLEKVLHNSNLLLHSDYYVLWSIGIMVAVYLISSCVDIARMFLLEKPIFKALDKYIK